MNNIRISKDKKIMIHKGIFVASVYNNNQNYSKFNLILSDSINYHCKMLPCINTMYFIGCRILQGTVVFAPLTKQFTKNPNTLLTT